MPPRCLYLRELALFLLVFLLSGLPAAAAGTVLKGRLLHSLTGEPVAGAKVIIQEDKREVFSAADGTFVFDNVRPGRYHLVVEAPGFSAKHREVQVADAPTSIDIAVDPELHFTEVVSVSAEPRDQFSSFQATSVLAGQDLARELGTTLAATLGTQPGVAVRSLGAAAARPVVRGLDGDRVLILQDGHRTGDLSSQSGDHGVVINPASASRIEVVRGPATLLYGSNAIGGIVNVISDAVPTRPADGVKGTVTTNLGSNGGQATGAGDLWWGGGAWVAHAGGGGSRSGEYSTPVGRVDNTQSRSGFGSAGVSWTSARGYLGGSYGYEDSRYGVPFVEEGQIELTPRRHNIDLRGEAKDLQGLFRSLRGSFSARRYRHEEIAGGEVGTQFVNDTNEWDLLANHRSFASVSGTVGASVLDRHFSATGEESLSPPVDQRGIAGFFHEEARWHHVTLELGARVDHVAYTPASAEVPARSFTSGSGSVGLLFEPPFANHAPGLAVSLARTSRHPALEELYFFGPHPGNFAFEIGNPNLGPEHALGIDVSFRWRSPRFSTEITYFRNAIDRYIFRNPLEAIPDAFVTQHPGADTEGFPVVQYEARDSVLQGIEVHGDVQVAARVFADYSIDYIRGHLTETGEPLPRIPPFRARVGLRYQHNALNIGGEITGVAAQDRVFGLETPTPGYGLGKLYGSYSFPTGTNAVSTITARVDNVTDTRYRNHLSYVKDVVEEMGRTFRFAYTVTF